MNLKKLITSFFYFTMIINLILINSAKGEEKASSAVAPGATFKTVKAGFNGTEGPAVDSDGNVYFTERSGSTIQKWTWADGKVTEYRKVEGGAIGQAFDTQGRLLTCEMGNKRVTRDDMKGNVAVVAFDHAGTKKLHIPNDIWVAPNGGIYFTDFSFASMKMTGAASGGAPGGAPAGGMPGSSAPGNAKSGQPSGGTPAGGAPGDAKGRQSGDGFPGGGPPGMNEKINPGDLGIDYISSDGKTVIRVADIESPNGIIGTSDGKTIYALEENKIVSFKINPDGTLTDKKIFCNQSTDGMAVDERGNVYLTGDGALNVYNSKGEKIEDIQTPEQRCTIMKFAGKDRKTLFLCGTTAVYTLEMAVKGAPTALDLAKERNSLEN
jgi:gluconolactonase